MHRLPHHRRRPRRHRPEPHRRRQPDPQSPRRRTPRLGRPLPRPSRPRRRRRHRRMGPTPPLRPRQKSCRGPVAALLRSRPSPRVSWLQVWRLFSSSDVAVEVGGEGCPLTSHLSPLTSHLSPLTSHLSANGSCLAAPPTTDLARRQRLPVLLKFLTHQHKGFRPPDQAPHLRSDRR